MDFQISSSMKLSQKAKDLIFSDPLLDALYKIQGSKEEEFRRQPDLLNLVRLTSHILEQENKM